MEYWIDQLAIAFSILWPFVLGIIGFAAMVWLRYQNIQREKLYTNDFFEPVLPPEVEPVPTPKKPEGRKPPNAHLPSTPPPDMRIREHDEWWPLAISAHHLMVVGETQEGKSTSVIALLREKAQRGSIIIIDPHEKLNDWGIPTANTGRDWGHIDQLMLALDAELSRRYLRGEDIGAPLTIIMDEVPAIMDECGNAPKTMMRLAREGAKVKMNLIIMTQDPNVESLKIQGQGAVRNNFSKLLLGSFAIKAYKDLEGKPWPAVLEHRDKKVRVSRARLPEVAQSDIGNVTTWNPPGEPLEKTQWSTEHVLVAALVAANPSTSRAEIARELWGGKGGGRRNEDAGRLMGDVQSLLQRRTNVEHDA